VNLFSCRSITRNLDDVRENRPFGRFIFPKVRLNTSGINTSLGDILGIIKSWPGFQVLR
jgi:hypothetical protein